MAFFKTSRAESNEVVKAEDVTFNFDSQVSNFSVLLQSLIDPTSDFVVGGNVSVMTGMNLSIEPILGCCKDSGICFVSTEKLTDGIVVSAAESQDRIDIVQIKAIEEDYDEQQRSFIDFETKIETIQNVFTKKRVILQVEVKKGVVGSVIAPETDYGFVKLAEIFVSANTTSISDSDIYNISANYKGEENANWTNEKDKTYNFQYLSDLNKEFQSEHNKDGSHKSKIIGSFELDYGVGNAQINNSLLPLGSAISIDGQTYNSTTATTTFLIELSNKVSAIFNDYYNKGGKYNFNGELVLSDVFSDNALTKGLKIKCDGAGFAYFYIGEKLIFTITESGKFIMPSGYNATASNEIITKTVTDAINTEIESINRAIEEIVSTSGANVNFINGVLSRFSFSDQEITVATNEKIELFGTQTIDGIALEVGNIVFVKNQDNSTQNGIYVVQTGGWNRHTNFTEFSSFRNKLFVISTGTKNKGKVFYTTQENCTIGEDSLVFVESFYKNLETKYTVPIRDSNGNIKTGTPSATNDAAPKKYVDDAETRAKNLENATGVLAVEKGGTGATTAKEAQYNLLDDMNDLTNEDVVDFSDATPIVCMYSPGGTKTTGSVYRRNASRLWEYIKGKISSVLGLTASNYNGNAKSATSLKRALLLEGTDLNSIHTQGEYYSIDNIQYPNAPCTNFTMQVITLMSNYIYQIVYAYASAGARHSVFVRNTYYDGSSTSWSGWTDLSDISLPAATSSTLGLVKVKKTTSIETSSSSMSITITSSNINKIIQVSVSSGYSVNVYNNSGVPLKVFITSYNSSSGVESVGIVPNGKTLKSNTLQSSDNSCYVYTEALNVIL